MDPVRFGQSVRALRRRRRWTQVELGRRAGCSRASIARIELGEGDRSTVRLLGRVLAALDARLSARVLWRGEELDRLLDADHARLVEATTRRLAAAGWRTSVEVTFQIYGERGAIDILAVHPMRDLVLVIEVKSVVPDVQATLSKLDQKVRLAPSLVRDRALASAMGAPASRILVLPADRTTRRRVDRHEATFDRALPARTIEVRRWLADPAGSIAGIMFVSDVTDTSARQRVAGPFRRAVRGVARSP